MCSISLKKEEKIFVRVSVRATWLCEIKQSTCPEKKLSHIVITTSPVKKKKGIKES